MVQTTYLSSVFMLPEGAPYTEDQLQQLIRLHNELRRQFMTQKDYAESLLQRVRVGEQLNKREIGHVRLFAKVSETLNRLEELILGELSANIIGICEDAKLRARSGHAEWVARWASIRPLYRAYMEIYTQRGLPKN